MRITKTLWPLDLIIKFYFANHERKNIEKIKLFFDNYEKKHCGR